MTPFLAACRCEPVPHTPVWFMRQAGRSLPEYRALREGVGMLEACTRPELIVEITLQPVRRLGVDAAVLFSDIVVPLRAAGVDLDIVAGVGPVIAEPIRSAADIERLHSLEPESLGFLAEALPALVAELGPVPLLGFAGAPFTLACYLIEGGPSKDHARTKALMHGEPLLWHRLMSWLASLTGAFLRAQVDAGASAVQLFDSWVGALSRRDYLEHVREHSAAALDAVPEVPRISFGLNTAELLGDLPGEVVGVDWRLPLSEAAARAGHRAVQGNLDPALILAPWPVVERAARTVLADAQGLPGHVFNLGHGVLPASPPETLARLVELVHRLTGPGGDFAR